MKTCFIRFPLASGMQKLRKLSNSEIAGRLRGSSAGANWSDERTETAKKLWADGLSASKIAALLGGVSRSAVIGKLHRLNLPDRGAAVARHNRSHSTKRKPTQTPTVAVASVSRVDKVRALVSDGLPIPPPAETDIPRIATVDLEPHHCRFPCVADVKKVGPYDPIFCGLKPHKGLPYCEIHARRAFQPPQPRPRPTFPMITAPVENEMEAA